LIDDATQSIFEKPFAGSKPHRQCPAQKDFDSDQRLTECSCDTTFQMDLGNLGQNHATGQSPIQSENSQKREERTCFGKIGSRITGRLIESDNHVAMV
jgi:hypothetical protein